jgi:hypothetical protein
MELDIGGFTTLAGLGLHDSTIKISTSLNMASPIKYDDAQLYNVLPNKHSYKKSLIPLRPKYVLVQDVNSMCVLQQHRPVVQPGS